MFPVSVKVLKVIKQKKSPEEYLKNLGLISSVFKKISNKIEAQTKKWFSYKKNA